MGQRRKVNDFNRDLEYSLNQRDCEVLDAFYRRVFPDLVTIEVVTDIALQRKGIDKILHLAHGQKIGVDEKKRRSDYGDILLELWSIKERRVEGWLFTTHCHYIVYVIMPTGKVYLLPTVLLRQAWAKNERTWRQQYAEISAPNPGYTTISIGIPPAVLLPAIEAEITKPLHPHPGLHREIEGC